MRGSQRVLIDASMITKGGGYTDTVNLLPQLSAQAPDRRFRVLVRSAELARSAESLPNLEVERLPEASWAQRFRFTHFDVPRLVHEWQADLYFSLAETAPALAGCPMIASFRNPVPYGPDRDLAWRSRLRLQLLRKMAWVSARACERIVFVSETSAAWLGDLLGLPEERRAVVRNGIDAVAWSRRSGEAPHAPRYILSVSSIYRHKNFVRLIEAYAALARAHDAMPDLLIIGDDQDPSYSARMFEARRATGRLAERIHILGEVPYAEIRRYYEHAKLFVFPSYLETFGHPLLEAMASGVPAVAADTAVFREVAGDAAIYADPYRTESLARAMQDALFTASGACLAERGRKRAESFSWRATGKNLLAVFDEVAAERTARGAVRPAALDALQRPQF